MRANVKAIDLFETEYINLSEQLREELELKIENLYDNNQFVKYAGGQNLNYRHAEKADFLFAYLIGRPPREYILSGKLLQGIKTWFNMYYDDRLSVIDKFRICYQKIKAKGAYKDLPDMSIIFCKFLINELLSTLADERWRLLIDMSNRN